jgi:hypothetical protein
VAEIDTVPLPVPGDPPPIVMNELLAAAVQSHLDPCVTVTVMIAGSAADGSVTLVGLTENLQGNGAMVMPFAPVKF